MSIEYPRSASHPWDSLLHHVISSWKTHHASRAQPSNENHFRNWICIGMFDNNNNNKRQTLNTQQKIQSFKLMSFCCRSSIQWKRIHSQHSKSSQAGPIYPFMWYMPIADSFTWSKIPKKKLSASVHQVQSTLFAYNWSIHCQKTFLFSSKTN
jgi:hypothetical protein